MSDPRKKTSQVNHIPPSQEWASIFDDDNTPVGADLVSDRELMAKLKDAKFKSPERTRVFTVANQKGGVGKTTSAVNVAGALAKGGLNILVIDADPQGNASTALGVEHTSGTPSVYEVMTGELPLVEAVAPSPDFDSLFVVPSTIDLSSAEIELVGGERREYRLRDALDSALITFAERGVELDYVIIDCPPSLGLLTLNALVAAHEILIPIQTEYYALEGLTQLMKSIESVRTALNPDVAISTILLTMFDKRTNLAQDVAREVRSYFPKETLSVEIPRNIRISEAPSFHQTVITYDPRSSGAIAYTAAAFEISERS
ncbi:ParA family protein [Arcanobacterium canis]